MLLALRDGLGEVLNGHSGGVDASKPRGEIVPWLESDNRSVVVVNAIDSLE